MVRKSPSGPVQILVCQILVTLFIQLMGFIHGTLEIVAEDLSVDHNKSVPLKHLVPQNRPLLYLTVCPLLDHQCIPNRRHHWTRLQKSVVLSQSFFGSLSL